jgi:hypothetical protein
MTPPNFGPSQPTIDSCISKMFFVGMTQGDSERSRRLVPAIDVVMDVSATGPEELLAVLHIKSTSATVPHASLEITIALYSGIVVT